MTTQRDIRIAVSVIEDAQEESKILTQVEWRTGRSNRANVYATTGGKNRDNDLWVGVFLSPQLALEAVKTHNTALIGAHGVNVTGSTGVQVGSHSTQHNVY